MRSFFIFLMVFAIASVFGCSKMGMGGLDGEWQGMDMHDKPTDLSVVIKADQFKVYRGSGDDKKLRDEAKWKKDDVSKEIILYANVMGSEGKVAGCKQKTPDTLYCDEFGNTVYFKKK